MHDLTRRDFLERSGALDHSLGFVDVEASRRKCNLERQARSAHGATRCMGLGERCARPLALVGLLGVPIEANLNGPDG